MAATEKLSAPTQGNPDVWEAFKGVVDAAIWDEVAEARIQFVAKLPSLVGSSRGLDGFVHPSSVTYSGPRERAPSLSHARRATALLLATTASPTPLLTHHPESAGALDRV